MNMTAIRQKVFAIGNRLAPRMGREAAFIEAWNIVRNGIELPLRGVMQGTRQIALGRFAAYAPEQRIVFVAPEKDNPVDNKAATVFIGIQYGRGFYTAGYLPKEYAPAAAVLKATGIKVLDGNIKGARIALTA